MPRIAKQHICPQCNSTFTGKSKYCSRKCAMQARHNGAVYACEYCGNTFYRKPSVVKTHLFCSHECASMGSRNRATATCQQCGNQYEVKAYRKDETKFCCRTCASKWELSHRTKKMVNHNLKGNKNRQGKRPTNAFRSEDVKGENNPRWINPVECTCKYCGERFYKKPWEMRGSGRTGEYCSSQCRNNYRREYMSGGNSPYYVGGIKTYRGRNWTKIRLVVIDNQQGKCANCGKFVGKSLPVHHIIPFREFSTAEKANRIDNLIGLCQSCHMKIEHKKA